MKTIYKISYVACLLILLSSCNSGGKSVEAAKNNIQTDILLPSSMAYDKEGIQNIYIKVNCAKLQKPCNSQLITVNFATEIPNTNNSSSMPASKEVYENASVGVYKPEPIIKEKYTSNITVQANSAQYIILLGHNTPTVIKSISMQ